MHVIKQVASLPGVDKDFCATTLPSEQAGVVLVDYGWRRDNTAVCTAVQLLIDCCTDMREKHQFLEECIHNCQGSRIP